VCGGVFAIREWRLQRGALHVAICKDACGIFGTNGVISTLFVLAAGDRLMVDL
jgi:hypothetical protein